MELECVFFSVTPTALRASRMALLLTSSSRARSLIRTLLIQSFLSRRHFVAGLRVLPSAQLAVHSQPQWSRSFDPEDHPPSAVAMENRSAVAAAITLLYPLRCRLLVFTADRPPRSSGERAVRG